MFLFKRFGDFGEEKSLWVDVKVFASYFVWLDWVGLGFSPVLNVSS